MCVGFRCGGVCVRVCACASMGGCVPVFSSQPAVCVLDVSDLAYEVFVGEEGAAMFYLCLMFRRALCPSMHAVEVHAKEEMKQRSVL